MNSGKKFAIIGLIIGLFMLILSIAIYEPYDENNGGWTKAPIDWQPKTVGSFSGSTHIPNDASGNPLFKSKTETITLPDGKTKDVLYIWVNTSGEGGYAFIVIAAAWFFVSLVGLILSSKYDI